MFPLMRLHLVSRNLKVKEISKDSADSFPLMRLHLVSRNNIDGKKRVFEGNVSINASLLS